MGKVTTREALLIVLTGHSHPERFDERDRVLSEDVGGGTARVVQEEEEEDRDVFLVKKF